MKTKIPIYNLIKALGITNKKIIITLKNKKIIKNIQNLNKIQKTETALIKITESLTEKETNLL